jgi:hypothetical protein
VPPSKKEVYRGEAKSNEGKGAGDDKKEDPSFPKGEEFLSFGQGLLFDQF